MRILIANDDGFDALGIKLLEEKLLPYGDVFVCAPNQEMSATSHSIKFSPISVSEVGVNHYKISSTPADCVRIANSLFGPFDIVFSGINNGLNLGTDIIYSGTVAAAREAVICGMKAVAISVDKDQLDIAQAELDYVLKRLFDNDWLSYSNFLNINFPTKKHNRSVGIKFAFQGIKKFSSTFEKKGTGYIVTSEKIEYDDRPLSDVYLASQGFITVVPLGLNQTDFQAFKELSKK